MGAMEPTRVAELLAGVLQQVGFQKLADAHPEAFLRGMLYVALGSAEGMGISWERIGDIVQEVRAEMSEGLRTERGGTH